MTLGIKDFMEGLEDKVAEIPPESRQKHKDREYQRERIRKLHWFRKLNIQIIGVPITKETGGNM